MPQEYRPSSPASDTIGFRELRQACEISALREDLERLIQGTQTLKEHVENTVEEVRRRFASLTADELADAHAMLPLLQFAIAQLISIREQARQTDTASGALSDESRAYWDATEPPPRPPAPSASSTLPAPQTRPEPRQEPPPSRPEPPSANATWMQSSEAKPPRPTPMQSRLVKSSDSIDWLSPPSRER